MEPCNDEIENSHVKPKVDSFKIIKDLADAILTVMIRAFVSANQTKLSPSMEIHNLEQLKDFSFVHTLLLM